MTDRTPGQMRPPLGVGEIIGSSISILFGNLVTMLMLAFVPTLLGLILSGQLVGWDITLGISGELDSDRVAPFVINTLIQIVVYGLTVALLVQAAYDAKLERPLQVSRYTSPALRAAVPIAILSIIVGLLTGLAMIALVIPGLWVYAVFAVMAPAVVIEGAGFGGLGRSAELTKEYRWPVLGALILVGLIGGVINFATAFIAGIISGAAGEGGILVPLLITAVVGSIGVGLGAIAVALIYARLREIKEGVGMRDIVSVFD